MLVLDRGYTPQISQCWYMKYLSGFGMPIEFLSLLVRSSISKIAVQIVRESSENNVCSSIECLGEQKGNFRIACTTHIMIIVP